MITTERERDNLPSEHHQGYAETHEDHKKRVKKKSNLVLIIGLSVGGAVVLAIVIYIMYKYTSTLNSITGLMSRGGRRGRGRF